MHWLILIISGVLEAVWATALDRSDGLTKLLPSIALTDSAYWVAALVSAGVAYAIDLGGKLADRVLLVVDFVGMGCWATIGSYLPLLVLLCRVLASTVSLAVAGACLLPRPGAPAIP